jgi:hypothetical protein
LLLSDRYGKLLNHNYAPDLVSLILRFKTST